MNTFKKIFCKKKVESQKEETIITVTPGDIYKFKQDDGNPFIETHKVEVLAVKNNWVNYRFCNNLYYSYLFQNESMNIDSFLYCYKKKD